MQVSPQVTKDFVCLFGDGVYVFRPIQGVVEVVEGMFSPPMEYVNWLLCFCAFVPSKSRALPCRLAGLCGGQKQGH